MLPLKINRPRVVSNVPVLRKLKELKFLWIPEYGLKWLVILYDYNYKCFVAIGKMLKQESCTRGVLLLRNLIYCRILELIDIEAEEKIIKMFFTVIRQDMT